MAITPEQAIILERLNTDFTKEKVAYEVHRRAVQSRIQLVSRWAMITRKMKKEEPSYDILNDFTDLICYERALPRNVLLSTDYITNVVLLLSSSKGREAEMAAGALYNIALSDNFCRAACVSAGAVPALVSLLSSSKGAEAEEAAGALCSIAAGDAACKAACVSGGALPALVSLLSSSKGAEAGFAAMALYYIGKGDATCKAVCVSATKPLLTRGDIPDPIKSFIENIV